MKKSDSGRVLFGFLVVLIILFIGIFVSISLVDKYLGQNFKAYFGVEAQTSWKTDVAARMIVQPLVAKRLGELNLATKQACGKAANEPPATTPEEIRQRLAALKNARAKCAEAERQEGDAINCAGYFGFLTQPALDTPRYP